MYYAGIDAHSQYLHVVVLDKDGECRAEVRVAVEEPAGVRAALARFRPLHVVVETCPFWPWIRDQVAEDQVFFHLAHSRELRAIAHHAQKNDAVDARLLARMLLTGLIPPAYAHAATDLERLRLVRHYAALIRTRTMFANRIHSQLHQGGVRLARERLLTLRGRAELKALAERLGMEQQRVIRTHLRVIATLDQLLKALRKQIRQQAEASAPARLLQSVPGIGPYWALLLSAELGPIQRFRSPNHLISYAGLAPITRSSGGHTTHGPLPSAANRDVRRALITATMSHVRYAPKSRLSESYARLKSRIGWKKARVATARKLARVIYGMLRTQRTWQY